MTVVLAILLLMAAIILPRAQAFLTSQNQRKTEAAILRMPIAAKNAAVKDQQPVTIRIDGTDLVEADTQFDSNGDITPASQTTELKRVPLGDDIQIVSTTENGQSTSSGTWQWTVYPDGSCDECAIGFSLGSLHKSLVLPSYGQPHWVDGDPPDPTQNVWQAGELLQRAE